MAEAGWAFISPLARKQRTGNCRLFRSAEAQLTAVRSSRLHNRTMLWALYEDSAKLVGQHARTSAARW